MNSKSITDVVGVASHDFLAVAPFMPCHYGGMKDADGDMVITCHDKCPPCTLYKLTVVDFDSWFTCPKCGTPGQRMEEASHRQVITSNSTR
jgi:hypothetical protein